MFSVYVIYSDRTSRFYTGQTSNLDRRLEEHNLGISRSTRHGAPWRLVYSEKFGRRSDAMKRERFFKTGKGRDELKALLGQKPEFLNSRAESHQPLVKAFTPVLRERNV